MRKVIVAVLAVCANFACFAVDDIIIECERFADTGGWTVDSQFIDEMGSSYLLAHGAGRPVADARTRITVPESGEYSVFARTKNWTAHWSDSPAGVFTVAIDGVALPSKVGTDRTRRARRDRRGARARTRRQDDDGREPPLELAKRERCVVPPAVLDAQDHRGELLLPQVRQLGLGDRHEPRPADELRVCARLRDAGGVLPTGRSSRTLAAASASGKTSPLTGWRSSPGSVSHGA